MKRLGRAHGWLMLVVAGVIGITATTPMAAEPIVFRLGTGGSAGTYYPIGNLIAEAISDHTDHHHDPRYAIPDLLVLAQRANGSVANVSEIDTGLLEAGLAQADVAHWAYHGTGPFAASGALSSLRAVATLYPESIHLVARRASGIDSMNDLVGKRVSLDEPGSGTLIDVRLLLGAFELDLEAITPVYLKPSDAIDRLVADELDAFFIIAGYPIAAVAALIDADEAALVPISGPAVERLVREHRFFSRDTIPAETYAGQPAVSTVAVGAQLLVNAALDDELVYRLTGRLWGEATTGWLRQHHPKGRLIRRATALDGIGLPLHPGAARYYREAGVRATTLPPR